MPNHILQEVCVHDASMWLSCVCFPQLATLTMLCSGRCVIFVSPGGVGLVMQYHIVIGLASWFISLLYTTSLWPPLAMCSMCCSNKFFILKHKTLHRLKSYVLEELVSHWKNSGQEDLITHTIEGWPSKTEIVSLLSNKGTISGARTIPDWHHFAVLYFPFRVFFKRLFAPHHV